MILFYETLLNEFVLLPLLYIVYRHYSTLDFILDLNNIKGKTKVKRLYTRFLVIIIS